jgi:hypothetical protein
MEAREAREARELNRKRFHHRASGENKERRIVSANSACSVVKTSVYSLASVNSSRRMRLAIALCMIGLFTRPSWAQGGHVAAGGGLSLGTGGPAPAVTVAAGYQPSPRIGFALELSVIPELDFGRRELPEILSITPLPALPKTVLTSTGGLTAVQVDVIVPITTAGKLRISAVAGGGTASLRTRIHLHRDAFTFPTFPGVSLPESFVLPPLPPLTLPAQDLTQTGTTTGLALNTGALLDYALSAKIGFGVDVRYLHTSASRDIDIARTLARVVWRF